MVSNCVSVGNRSRPIDSAAPLPRGGSCDPSDSGSSQTLQASDTVSTMDGTTLTDDVETLRAHYLSHVPSHGGTASRVHTDPFVLPLVDMLGKINDLMRPWNSDHEIMSGLIHANVPDFDHQAFREAIVNTTANAMVNASCHRDYAQIGSIRFMIDAGGLIMPMT